MTSLSNDGRCHSGARAGATHGARHGFQLKSGRKQMGTDAYKDSRNYLCRYNDYGGGRGDYH